MGDCLDITTARRWGVRDRLFSLSLVCLLLKIELEDAFTVLLYARLAVRYTLSPFPFFLDRPLDEDFSR